MNPSDFMRLQLATVGIFLDEPKRVHQPPRRQAVEPEPVDRGLVREILAAAGAPDRDLDWMVASCPGVEYALAYQPTARQAWCIECSNITLVDDKGCTECRGHGHRPFFEPLPDEAKP